MFFPVFCCWVQAFPHTQTIGVIFPCGELCPLFFFLGLLSSLHALLAAVSKFVLGHCELPICWLSFPILGLWIAAIVNCVFVATGVPWIWVVAELFWPR